MNRVKKPIKQFEKCPICNINFKSVFAKQCIECYNKQKKGVGNPNYRTGKWCNNFYCPICGKKVYCDTKTGLCYNCWSAQNIKSNHWHWLGGWKSKSKCVDCGKDVSFYALRCKSCSHKGELHYLYIDGKGCDRYPSDFNNYLKNYIRNRDCFKCQYCETTERQCKTKYNETLSIHHIDYNKQNCKEYNLISLCKTCHLTTNYNRDYWHAYYKYIIENEIYKGVNND